MSKYCGKCDFYDYYNMYDADEFIANTEVRVGKHVLKLKTELDLLKYAPYIIGLAFSNKDNRVVELSKEPFIDREERESIKNKLSYAKRLYNKYQKEKKEFIPQKVAKEHPYSITADRLFQIILNRVKENPKNPKVDDLSTDIAKMYRDFWVKDLIIAGMDETSAILWVYPDNRKYLILKERGLLKNVKF